VREDFPGLRSFLLRVVLFRVAAEEQVVVPDGDIHVLQDMLQDACVPDDGVGFVSALAEGLGGEDHTLLEGATQAPGSAAEAVNAVHLRMTQT